MEMDSKYNDVTPAYFHTMGIPLLRGRDFNEYDTKTSLPVTIVNEAFVRRYFPTEDPVGRRIRRRGNEWSTIVGVVGSVKFNHPGSQTGPEMFTPVTQEPGSWMTVAVRAGGAPEDLGQQARAVVRSVDPDVPVLKLRTMRQVVSDSLEEPRLLAAFLTGFAVFALALAALGVYGVIAYAVAQRTQEMGIRVALGASARQVLAHVTAKGLALTGLGLAAGLPLALAAARLMSALLYLEHPGDIEVYTAVLVLLALVGLGASLLPARRAGKIDPITALRWE
jgi:putative ABC transport system permease protein